METPTLPTSTSQPSITPSTTFPQTLGPSPATSATPSSPRTRLSSGIPSPVTSAPLSQPPGPITITKGLTPEILEGYRNAMGKGKVGQTFMDTGRFRSLTLDNGAIKAASPVKLSVTSLKNRVNSRPDFVYSPDFRIAGNKQVIDYVISNYVAARSPGNPQLMGQYQANYIYPRYYNDPNWASIIDAYTRLADEYDRAKQEEANQKALQSGKPIVTKGTYKGSFELEDTPLILEALTGEKAKKPATTTKGKGRRYANIADAYRAAEADPKKVLNVNNVKPGGSGYKLTAAPTGQGNRKNFPVPGYPKMVAGTSSTAVEGLRNALYAIGLQPDGVENTIREHLRLTGGSVVQGQGTGGLLTRSTIMPTQTPIALGGTRTSQLTTSPTQQRTSSREQ